MSKDFCPSVPHPDCMSLNVAEGNVYIIKNILNMKEDKVEVKDLLDTLNRLLYINVEEAVRPNNVNDNFTDLGCDEEQIERYIFTLCRVVSFCIGKECDLISY